MGNANKVEIVFFLFDCFLKKLNHTGLGLPSDSAADKLISLTELKLFIANKFTAVTGSILPENNNKLMKANIFIIGKNKKDMLAAYPLNVI